MRKKYVDFSHLTDSIAQWRELNPSGKVVHCHGVFDLLHPGHLFHLQEALSLGDFLVVTVTSDRHVNKGPGRPFVSEEDRAYLLSALDIVGLVAISDYPNASSAIEAVKGDYFVKGPDYADEKSDISGNLEKERLLTEKYGGKLAITTGRTMSSSRFRNQILLETSTEFGVWLENFRKQVDETEVSKLFNSIEKLRVLVIGEVIIDEYVNCEALGKSSKDPVLAFKILETERQLGGCLAVAKHAAGLGAQVTVLSRIADSLDDITFIQSGLPSSVVSLIQTSKTEPTIIKTRFVDSLTGNKVFETYKIDDEGASESDRERFSTALADLVRGFDLILVTDYGHGLLTKKDIEIISAAPGLKAVNTQSNAGNRGFNFITKYPVVDIVCLNGSEVALELKKRHVELDELLPELAARTQAKFAAVTSGSKGAVYLDSREENSKARKVPAFATKVQDRVGAGDALFVAAALSWSAGASGMLATVMGNLAGAASIVELGNRVSLDKISIQKHLMALLK